MDWTVKVMEIVFVHIGTADMYYLGMKKMLTKILWITAVLTLKHGKCLNIFEQFHLAG